MTPESRYERGRPSLEVGISTMNAQDPLALCQRMGLVGQGVRVLIINQCPSGPLPADVGEGPVRMFSFRESGVARSRNRVLAQTRAEVLLFADDDLTYLDGLAARLQRAMAHDSGAAVITFPVLALETGLPTRRFPRKAGRHTPFSITGVGTPEIAVRPARLSGVRFDEGFGLGAPHPQGDEPIFLRDVQRAGLRISYWPEALCQHSVVSSGRRPWTTAMVQTKRAVLQRMYPGMWPWMAAAMCATKYRPYGASLGPLAWVTAWSGGEGRPAGATKPGSEVALASADVHSSPSLAAQGPAVSGLVTVFIPTRGRSRLLRRALSSALAQTAEVEVIVVSDGPDRETDSVMAPFERDPRVRYLRLLEPGGACAARNHALRHARGQYVTGLDDDDSLAPDHVARLLSAYRPGYALAAAAQRIHYPDRTVHYAVDHGEIDLDALLHYNKVGNHALAERDRVLAVGGFDERLPAFQDYDLWVRLVDRYGPALKLSAATYRLHLDHGLPRISDQAERKQRALALFMDKHRASMSRGHLRSMALLAHKHSGQSLGLAQALIWLRPGNGKAVLSLLVNTRAPALQRAYHRFVARSR